MANKFNEVGMCANKITKAFMPINIKPIYGDVDGDIVIYDVFGNVWNPLWDDQKGEKEDWEASILEAELDNFPPDLDPRL